MTNKKTILIDVREPDEYAKEHIEWAINIPMSTIHFGWKEKFKPFEDHQIIVLCESWNRAAMSKKIIENDCKCDVRVYEWGLIWWKEEWKETFWNKWYNIPVMRQVQIAIWVLSLIFGLLAYFVHPSFVFGNIGLWAWLTFAGITWNCMLAMLIAKLPFNNK